MAYETHVETRDESVDRLDLAISIRSHLAALAELHRKVKHETTAGESLIAHLDTRLAEEAARQEALREALQDLSMIQWQSHESLSSAFGLAGRARYESSYFADKVKESRETLKTLAKEVSSMEENEPKLPVLGMTRGTGLLERFHAWWRS